MPSFLLQQIPPARRIFQCRPWLVCLWMAIATLATSHAATQPRFDLALVNELLSHAQPGDEVVYLGDMAFRVDDLLDQQQHLQENRTRSATPSGVKKWPGGRVPYVYDSGVTATMQAQFEEACRAWEAVANVHFVPADEYDSNALYVVDSDVNTSYLGMVGGFQEVNIFNWTYKYIICHELAHALGMCHEQCRSDRDTYVTINTANIEPGQEHNFTKISSTNLTPYDFDSVMHYGPTAFSWNGRDTIVPKPGYEVAAATMGQVTHLSASDIQGMSGLYGSGSELEVNYSGHTVHDGRNGGTGNGDSIVNPGESIALGIEVVNNGTTPVTGITGYLSTTNPHVTVTDRVWSIPDLAAGATATTGNFAFKVSSDAQDTEIIDFKLIVVSSQGRVDRNFPVTVASVGNLLSYVQVREMIIDDTAAGIRSGNGDGLPDPGESVGLVVTLQNVAIGEETNVRLHATETSDWLSFIAADLKYSTLSTGVSQTRNGLELKISPSAPRGTSIPLTFTITSDQVSRVMTIPISIPLPLLPPPSISPPAGSFNNPIQVTLASSIPGTAIYYTTDSTDPTSRSPLYTGPFTVGGSQTVKAMGIKDGYRDSAVSYAFFFIAVPSASFDEVFHFDNNQTPPGWELRVAEDHASAASIANGRFEVRPNDTSADLRRNKQLPPGATGIRTEYTGNIAGNPEGMGGQIHLVMQNGDDYFVSLGKAGRQVNEITASAGTGSPASWQQNFTPDYGIYQVSAEFRDGEILFSAVKQGASAPLFTNTISVPGLDVQLLASLRFSAFTSSGDPSWMDAIKMTAILEPKTAAPIVRPPGPAPAFRATKLAAGGGKLRTTVTFTDPDGRATTYLVELRSLSTTGKWSPWKTVKTLPASDSERYTAPLSIKKARSCQIRITAMNQAGKSTSRAVTLRAPAASL